MNNIAKCRNFELCKTCTTYMYLHVSVHQWMFELSLFFWQSQIHQQSTCSGRIFYFQPQWSEKLYYNTRRNICAYTCNREGTRRVVIWKIYHTSQAIYTEIIPEKQLFSAIRQNGNERVTGVFVFSSMRLFQLSHTFTNHYVQVYERGLTHKVQVYSGELRRLHIVGH